MGASHLHLVSHTLFCPLKCPFRAQGVLFWSDDYCDHSVARNLEGKSAALPFRRPVAKHLPHLVSTPCLHTLSPRFVGYASSPHFVPTLCQKLKRVRTGCLRLGFRKSLTLSRALSPLSKESIESMDSNDSILSDCSILSIRSTTPTSRRRRHCLCLLPLPSVSCPLSPASCPPPVPTHPPRRPGISSRYSK